MCNPEAPGGFPYKAITDRNKYFCYSKMYDKALVLVFLETRDYLTHAHIPVSRYD